MKRISKTFMLATVVALASGTYMGSALAALSGFLIEDFSLSNAQFGLLATTFTLGGAISAYSIGMVADRIGGRRLLRSHFGLCLAGIIAAAISGSYLWLILSVAIAGLASASANPATNRLIVLNVPPGLRAAVVGVKATGQPLSVILAGAILPTAAIAWGWRASLALGTLLPLSGMLLMRSVPVDNPSQFADRLPRSIGAKRAIKWLAMNGFAVGGGAAAVVTFLPLFGQKSIGLSTAEAGALLSTAGIMSLAGRLLWGRMTGRFRHVNVALTWVSIVSIASTLTLILSDHLGSAPLVWIAAATAGLTMLSWNAVGMAAIVSEVDVASAGRASGTVMAAFLAGWMITPSLFGWTLDVTGSFAAGWLIVLVLHAIALVPLFLWRTGARTVNEEWAA